MLGLNILDQQGKFKQLRQGLTPISFVKIARKIQSASFPVEAGAKATVSRKTLPAELKNAGLAEVFRHFQDNCSRIKPAVDSGAVREMYILGKIPGGATSAIKKFDDYYELSNIMYCKFENNIEGMADQFSFSFPLMSSSLSANNNVAVLNILKSLCYINTDKVSEQINQETGILNRCMKYGRFVEIYLGYKENLMGDQANYDNPACGMERFTGVIDSVAINELYGIVTLTGRDLTGPLLDIKTAAGFKSREMSIASVLDGILDSSGYYLFNNLLDDNTKSLYELEIKSTEDYLLKQSSDTTERSTSDSGLVMNRMEQLRRGRLAYLGKEESGVPSKTFASAARIFYDSYSNETISIWDVIQSAAILTGHITYVIPGTNVIYFGIPTYCNISSITKSGKYGYIQSIINDISLPLRNHTTWSIDAPGNCFQFKYSIPAKTGSNFILVVGSYIGDSGYSSVAVHPDKIYYDGAESEFIADISKIISESATLNTASENGKGRGTDMTYYSKRTKINYSIIIANTKSSFTDSPELLAFSAAQAYKRMLLSSVKVTTSIIGCPIFKSTRAVDVFNADILNSIFNIEIGRPVTMSINEATHEFSSETGYKTDLILEKFYSDGTFSSLQKLSDTTVVTNLGETLRNYIEKLLGQNMYSGQSV